MTGLRELLDKYGIRAVHDRGQNFLVDDSVLDSVIAAAEVEAGDNVLEVGPGPGMLTEKLLARGAFVVGVELDGRFQRLLTDRFAGRDFRLVSGDALEQASGDLVRNFPDPTAGYKVVANIPYGITSRLLLKFLREPPMPTVVTVMVQKEVADRVVAEPGGMNRLAVTVQSLGVPRKIRNVSRGSFSPPPRVDSAVLRVDLRKQPQLANMPENEIDEYLAFVGRVFSSPRRKISNLLAGEAGGKERANRLLAASGINPQARPTELTASDWITLFVQVKIG
jgi:16S rRNA (adenine1518-N6/adenine1519-N6)-dimethyltransferase